MIKKLTYLIVLALVTSLSVSCVSKMSMQEDGMHKDSMMPDKGMMKDDKGMMKDDKGMMKDDKEMMKN